MEKPKTVSYLSTWEFVRDYDKWAQKNKPGYTKRSFAKWAKINSPNFVSLVISRKRTLKGVWLDKFIKASQLSSKEETHFRKLSDFENAKSTLERESILAQIKDNLSQDSMTCVSLDFIETLSNPNIWTVFHMLDLDDQECSPIWFKRRLRFVKIDGASINDYIKILERLKLVSRTDGKLISQQKQIISPDQVRAESNVLYHRQVLKEADTALNELEAQERAFGSMTATVARENISELKNEINKFGQYLITKYASKNTVDGEVYRLNIQLYPLTSKKE